MQPEPIESVASKPEVHARLADSAEQYGRQMTTGALYIFVIQVAALPIGILISAFLARSLGPGDYGLYAVAASIIAWLQSSITALFNRSAVKFTAEAGGAEELHWQTVTSGVVRIQFVFGVSLAAVVFLVAPFVAATLGAPDLVLPLRLFTLGIPVFAVARGYASALMGRRAFGRGALFPAVHSLTRLALVFLLVGAGWGVTGAVLATLGGLAAELIYARVFVHAPLFARVNFPLRRFLFYSLPLSLDTLSRRLSNGIDLWVVQAISGSTVAGYYGAADNFSISGNLIGASLSSPLLATLTHLWKQGQTDGARAIISQVLRLTFCLLPFAALGAGAASEIVVFIYGNAYSPAAPLLAWLCFAALAALTANLTTSILAAVGRPGVTFAITGPLLLPAVALSLFLVPRVGAIGAAVTAAIVTWAGALGTMAALYYWCRASPGRMTIARTGIASLVAYALATVWRVPGAWLIPQLLVLSGIVLLMLYASRELTRDDLTFAVSLLKRDDLLDRLEPIDKS